MQYAVRYFDKTQCLVSEETLEASSEAELRDCLQAAGRTLLELRVLSVERGRRGRSPDFDTAWWCRELRTLLRAGMTVVDAIETQRAQAGTGLRSQVHARLLRALHEGQSLSRAMRSCEVFPDVLIAGVAGSERTSTLVESLDDYLRYDQILERLRRQAVSSAIYPLVVITLGTAISLFLLFYVVPRFSRMYAGVHTDLSAATQFVLWLSSLMRDHVQLVAGALAAAVLLAAWAWQRGWIAGALNWLVSQAPLIAEEIEHYKLAKLYQSLALMFRGGYPLDEAMELCLGLELGAKVSEGLKTTRRHIARGRDVAASLADAGLTDAVSQRLLAVGQRTGEFDAVLQTIADRHAERFSTFVERATRIIEPVLLLLVALLVGGLVVMLYMPVFDIANSVR